MEKHQILIDYLSRIKDIPDENVGDIVDSFTYRTVKRGDFITEYGKVNDLLAFVSSGYFRVYVLDPKGNEETIHIAGNMDFVGAITSFLGRVPSEEYVEAVTDAELFTISHQTLMKLYDKAPIWEHYGRIIMEKLFLMKQRRVVSFISNTAEERYRNLLEKQPQMLLHVPMQYIASYLGVTPETLSRIRARIS